MKHKKSIPIDAIMSAVVILLVLALAVDGFLRQKIPMEAAKYPLFVFVVTAAAGAIEIVRGVGTGHVDAQPVFENRKNFLSVCGMVIGYFLAMWLLGFVISTIAFSALFAWRFRLQHLLAFDIAAAAVTIALYYCFEKLLYIFLPTGLVFEMFFS